MSAQLCAVARRDDWRCKKSLKFHSSLPLTQIAYTDNEDSNTADVIMTTVVETRDPNVVET